MTYNTLVVLLGTGLLGACSGLVGTFAVLKRRALVGDAMAHSALPGLCLGFLVAGSKSLPPMLLGALFSGLVGVAVIALLRRGTRVKEDAAVGLVLSVFFGAGIALSGIIQRSAEGGSKAGLDSFILGKTAGMVAQDVWLIGGVALACLALILALYKEFGLVAFDPEFAITLGLPSGRLDFLLMGLVTVTVVIGLSAVGVVLMAALLILPGASARFWSDRLGLVLLLASAFGAGIGVIGTLLSVRFAELPAGPIIVLSGTAVFLASMLFAPRRGLLSRVAQLRRQRRLLARQAGLRQLWRGEQGGQGEHREAPARGSAWVREARRLGLVEGDRLTASGRDEALEVVRSDRIRERLLEREPESALRLIELDSIATVAALPAELRDELIADLRREGRWPERHEPGPNGKGRGAA